MRRTKPEREKDLVLITEMYTKNFSVRAIADEINRIRHYSISFQMVFKDIQCVLKEWQQKKEDMISNHVAIELEKSLIRERKLWEEWESSKEVRKTVKVKKKGKTANGPENLEMESNEAFGIGYYKFIELMQKEADFRCKLLGSFAPTEVKGEFTGNLFFELMKQATESEDKQ